MSDVYIISAVRTPIGSFNGSLSTLQAHELGAVVIKEALKRANIDNDRVSEVILGQVFTAAQGQNPARQASVLAGLPYEVPAWTLNMLCGSGLKAVELGMYAIKNGSAHVVVAGGQECMSQTPHAISIRTGTKMGDTKLVDTMVMDGLTDAFHNCHMGKTAENIVEKYSISRDEQDLLAYKSQMKTKQAYEKGWFDNEIVPVPVKNRKGVTEVTKDEFPHFDTSVESLSKLRPCFTADGSVTAGNASGINDGAAVVVLADETTAKLHNISGLYRIVSTAQTGIQPHIMGMGPVSAVLKAVKLAKWNMNDVDLFELNEAFAGQAIACVQQLEIDPEKVNVNGGAIALGHPLGASGARILVTLVHAMTSRKKTKGVAALCIGGGMGIAMCIERV